MLNLAGLLPVDKLLIVKNYTDLRLSNAAELETPEALTLYENNLMSEQKIRTLCEKHYCMKFEPYAVSYVPKEYIRRFKGTMTVPVSYSPSKDEVTVIHLLEKGHEDVDDINCKVRYVAVPIYEYISHFQRVYGSTTLLKRVPTKQLLGFIVSEAVSLGAADITITTEDKATYTYYNVRKKKVRSSLVFDDVFMKELPKLLTMRAPFIAGSRDPKYVDYTLSKDYRARVVINSKYGGTVITMRLLPNEAFTTSIFNLGLSEETAEWLLSNILDNEPGLRLIVGATMSGKNTTALALLKEIAEEDILKIVSVEMPVEQELPKIEQINTETVEEYNNSIKSLIHQNPDFVYITEIRDVTGLSTLQITNTGKCVLSTLHSNSVADTITRLMDVTGMSQDRVLQALHSVVYQELIRDEEQDKLYPRCRYVRLTKELKYQLYGKSIGEVMKIINSREGGDEWTSLKLVGR